MVAKRGRPSKSGERYKCRKLRTAETSKQPISPALWQRIKTSGQKIGLDPRLGTELGRLALHDELTSAQVSAGFRIAEIYHAFEHFHGRTRSAAGSSFFRQFVADLEKPIEVGRRRSDDYIDLDREERECEARENFDVLQYYMPVAQRDLVEQVCVEGRPINPVSIPTLKLVLQYFFEIFRDYAFQFDDLGHHGLRDQLRDCLKTGDSVRSQALITDEILNQFAIVARWDDVADRMIERYKGIASRLVIYPPGREVDSKTFERWGEVARAVRQAG
jgi:hypothetical protein